MTAQIVFFFVSTGIPGCSVANVEVFLPLKGTHEEIDPHALAKTLSDNGRRLFTSGDDATDIDDRATGESVCVVYDMSHSMRLPAFPNDEDADADADDEEQAAMTADDVRFEMWRLMKFERETFNIVRDVSAMSAGMGFGSYGQNFNMNMGQQNFLQAQRCRQVRK